MIVCLCTAASERDVHDAIEGGVRCLCDFKSRGIGTSCGGCHDTLRKMMIARGTLTRELCTEESILAGIRPEPASRPAALRARA